MCWVQTFVVGGAVVLSVGFATTPSAWAGVGNDACSAGLSTGDGGGSGSSAVLSLQGGRFAAWSDVLTVDMPIHCWRFTVPAASYVWAFVDCDEDRSGLSRFCSNTRMRLLSRATIAPTPPVEVESDDDDGFLFGPSIAGRLFTRSSEVFVQVLGQTPPSAFNSLTYRLYVFVTRDPGDANFTLQALRQRPLNGDAPDLLVPGKLFGLAEDLTPGDTDGYMLPGLRERELIVVSVDGSPMTTVNGVARRAATNAAIGISVGRADGTVGPMPLVFGGGPAGIGPSSSNPASRTLSFVVPPGGAGDYRIRLTSTVGGLPFRLLAVRAGFSDAFGPASGPSSLTNLSLALVNPLVEGIQGVPVRLTYRISNTGAVEARRLALRVTPLPLDLNPVITGTAGPCGPAGTGWTGALVCPLPPIPAGQSGDLTVVTTSLSATTPTSWSFPAALVSMDPRSDDALDATHEDNALLTSVVAMPSLALGVTATGVNLLAGGIAQVRADIRNKSPGPSSGTLFYTLTLNVPAPLALRSIAPAANASLTCTGSGQQRVCTGALGKNAQVRVDVEFDGTAGLPPGTLLPVEFSVAPVAPAVDSTDGNNVAVAAVQIIAPATATDADGDTLSNDDELEWGLDPNDASGDNGPNGDPDGDGATNAAEMARGTHPRGFVTRYFAEGATGGFFDERIALLSTGVTTARVLVRGLRPAPQSPVSQLLLVAPNTRATVELDTLPGLESTAVSVIVESDTTIVADRTMSWDATGYGGHAETAVSEPRSTWYFAEGSTAAGFNLFYLLQNPGTVDASVTVEYLRPAPATPVTRTYTVAANSRQNVWVNQEGPELASTDVSAIITSTIPIIAERAMYLDRQGQPFGAGHVAVGIAESKLQWLLAEGATGPYFDLFVLLANPNDTDATAEVRFLKPDGGVITRTKTVPARSRSNIWVDVEDPALADTAVSTTVRSTNGVTLLVERAMWWPGEFPTWHEAHASAGVTTAGARWALAEGEVGGPRHVATYVLLANTGPTDVDATVTLLFETGASVQRTFRVGANSRSNVDVGVEFPEAANQRFGTQVRVLGEAPVLVVERAMYWDADGVTWAAGTNAVGTRLP